MSAGEWAEAIFGDDADDIRATAEQIIAEDGLSLHITMVLPIQSAREWLDAYNSSLHAMPDAVASMLMFLEHIATQIEEGLEMEPDDGYIITDYDDWEN